MLILTRPIIIDQKNALDVISHFTKFLNDFLINV
jgi:hypothetical protein